jgi:hypothetical protein
LRSAPDGEEITVPDFLEETRKEIAKRLEELRPLADEYSRLEEAAVALAGAVGDIVGTAASEAGAAVNEAVAGYRGRGRPRGSSTRKKGPGRPRGSGKRARKATAASTPAASTAGATAAVTADATPAIAGRKKPGRPKGSTKKVGRPPGSGKKVGRPPGSATKAAAASTKRRGGRPKGGGKRAIEALSLVQGQPGITIPELAAKMGIKQNYLYRVLPPLEKEGKLQKKGRGWHPKAG